MSDTPGFHTGFPSNAQWRDRYKYTLRSLSRDTTRFKDLTLRVAPTDLNRPHIDYMLRPSYVLLLAETFGEVADGLYNLETHARYRHHRPDDWGDLNTARKHLREAVKSLTRITERHQGKGGPQ